MHIHCNTLKIDDVLEKVDQTACLRKVLIFLVHGFELLWRYLHVIPQHSEGHNRKSSYDKIFTTLLLYLTY